MNDYQPNSHKFKEEQKQSTNERKKVEKVTTGVVKTKKNELRNLKSVFISEDISNVKSYILKDVLIPTIKNAVSDIITNGIDMILYGSSGGNRKRSTASKVSYRNYYDNKRDNRSYSSSKYDSRHSYSYDDIILETRGEAEEVLSNMDDMIEMYDTVSVADLYDLVGITSEYTDNKYGWSNLRNAQVVRVREGYALKLPRAMPID